MTSLLKFAVYHTIQRHPALCYGLIEKTNNAEAHSVQLRTIEWDDVVEVQNSSGPQGDHDKALSKHIGVAHEHLFTESEQKPPWKLFILKHDEKLSDGSARVDISFINHHGIGDGSSGSVFHKTLLKFLFEGLSGADLQVSWPYQAPADLTRLPLLEEAFPFPQEPEAVTVEPSIIAKETTIDAWTAIPPSMENLTSRVHISTIPGPSVKAILANCRRLQVTLTGLLHGLIIMHLSRAIETAQAFKGVTPYSMRRFTGTSDDEIVNHISYITTDWKEPLLSTSRSITEGSKEQEELIQRINQQFSTEITDELAQVPTRGPSAIVELSKIPDFDQYCIDGMQAPRNSTYEISNVGVITLPERPEGIHGIELDKLVFTQCGMVAGPAIGCSVISVKGKALVVSLHWQEGIVDEALMASLGTYIERRLLGFDEA